ncbi:hypothetical protein [Virgibacillus halodenitrificans]|uniref:hypothetical protein n=1 Tax=Virgibacillus halodenitrificans TaxID=1482 RepID=UPI000EF543B3|nr:hypothetical protein [Virgibacillus halodenitrificans]
MKERIIEDMNGLKLIIKHRKSAVFFERIANIAKPNAYKGEDHKPYICITELKCNYRFSEEMFQEFRDYCKLIASESWSSFTPKEIDSVGTDYDDYYDKDFDNNGSLSISKYSMNIEGPYTQLKSNGEIVRLIKFNKRKFESFLFDLNRLVY